MGKIKALAGRRGSGGLYLFVDFIIAVIIVGVLYINLNNFMQKQAANLSPTHPAAADLAARVLTVWNLVLYGFIVACLLRAFYYRSNISSMRSLMTWVFIICFIFGFLMVYLVLDNLITYQLKDFVPASIQARLPGFISAYNLVVSIWYWGLWLVPLALLGYGALVQEFTPESEVISNF